LIKRSPGIHFALHFFVFIFLPIGGGIPIPQSPIPNPSWWPTLSFEFDKWRSLQSDMLCNLGISFWLKNIEAIAKCLYNSEINELADKEKRKR